MGECFVFPKIDGTNASVWWNGKIKAGSRKRELNEEQDNANFYKTIKEDNNIKSFLIDYPELRLYGEWLVPHSLKTYRENAWRKFYVFDVTEGDVEEGGRYLNYDEYKPLMENYEIEYIPCLMRIENGKKERFEQALKKNNYLIDDEKGFGEGIVIKNYNYKNRFGRTVWAKIVTSEFKEKHIKEMGEPTIIETTDYEEKFINDYCTETFIKKEYSKMSEGWTSKMIPKLLGIIWHELVTENIWDAIKKYKNPKLDFGRINKLCIYKTKKVLNDLF